MRSLEYYSYVGSYEGAVKLRGKWVRVKNLNYIEKPSWKRWQGPPNKRISDALNHPTAIDARELFPWLIK